MEKPDVYQHLVFALQLHVYVQLIHSYHWNDGDRVEPHQELLWTRRHENEPESLRGMRST